ncbi:MAG: hypothetical protein DMG62_06400 [Acidobacteria bacterium]|nr:MAG: hypothetical protein DMG62_06400 [Acidobacteriota bacterium]
MQACCPALFVGVLTASCVALDQKPQGIYKTNCEGCHEPTGRASEVGRSLRARSFKDSAVLKIPPATLARVVAKGKNQMPPFEGALTAKEIRDLTKYIKEMK